MAVYQSLLKAIDEALALLGERYDSLGVRLLLLAIAFQESSGTDRDQGDDGVLGPALGLWQFEINGVRAVLNNPRTRAAAVTLCAARGVETTTRAIWLALRTDDVLAAGFARLMLYADPAPLPAVGAVLNAWGYYVRNWHPGKPRVKDWPINYTQAMDLLSGGNTPCRTPSGAFSGSS